MNMNTSSRFGGVDSDIAVLELMVNAGASVDHENEDQDVMMMESIPLYDSDDGDEFYSDEDGGEGYDEVDHRMLVKPEEEEGMAGGCTGSDDVRAAGGGDKNINSSDVYSPCSADDRSRGIKQQEMEISPARRKAASQANKKTTSKASKKGLTEEGSGDAADADAAKPKPKPRARKATRASGQDDAKQKEAAMAKRKQASIDQRRKRNREAMQRARQRDKDYMDDLRNTARELQRKHNALLATVNEQIAMISSTSGSHVSDRVTELQDKLQVARDQAEALKRQNLKFLEEIGDRIKREDRMEGLLRELMREQQAQEHIMNEIFRESLSESQMSAFYTEERAMREIIRSRNDKRQVERQGFEKSAICGDLFGWSTKYRYEDKLFFFSFAKTFRNRSAARVMETNWSNELKMVTYRNSVEAATQRWHTLQKINDDTYLLAREKRDPDKDGEYVRLLYLRFRLHEEDGSYSVVTQSVHHDQVLYEGLDEIWANEACSWTHFTPMYEQCADGSVQEHCQIRMVGKSTIGSEKTARENILETIMGLLRWENINVGPMLSLANV